MDELLPSTLYAIDTLAASNAGWRALPIANSPATNNRWGQRFLPWGSSLFMFGGVTAPTDGSAPVFRSDLYALQLTAALTNAQTPLPGWNLVSSTPQTGPTAGITPGFPPGRVGPSWTSYTVGALLFGGVGTNDGSAPWPACFQNLSPATPAPAQCVFHHHVWAFLPGTTDWFVPGSDGTAQKYDPTAWLMLPDRGANGGAVPAGRTEHCAGHLGDQLYIYGGFTATGPVAAADALWTYNIVSGSWANIAVGGVAPSTGRGTYFTGTFIARHFYIYAENYNSAGGYGGGQLWRFSPNTAAVAPPAPAPAAATVSVGHTWGIVIGILIGLANLYFLWLLVQNAGLDVLPAALAAYLPSSLGGGGGAKPGAGYYSAAPGGAAAAGGYAAPSGGP